MENETVPFCWVQQPQWHVIELLFIQQETTDSRRLTWVLV